MKPILILLLSICASFAQVVDPPAKNYDLMKLSPREYQEWGQLMVKESERDKAAFGASSKKMLLTMMGLESKPQVHGLFDIEPIFNRSLLFAIVASQNKILLDDEDMENLKNECAFYAREKITDETQKAVALAFYGLIYSQNEKLKENPTK